MSRYTLELSYIEDDKKFKLFDDNFPLYEETHREEFIQKFYDRYRFREIGAETVGRFKIMLNSKLRLMYDFYKEYYKTCIALIEKDMLETKNLEEKTTREIIGSNTMESTNTSTSNTSSDNRFLDTPTSKIGDSLDGYVTNASVGKGDGNSNSESNASGTNNQKETITFTSIGDIGVQSPAPLIKQWREVITDIDQLMLDELECLFFGLY